MKKIIDGKRFDTETATKVDSLTSDCNPGDGFFEDTQIYRTKNGNWFLAGRGGLASRWGGCGESGGIRPIDASEAQKFLEREGNVAAIEEYFQDSIVDA
ncbi:hypothetical protein V1291_003598 [Nitrobacteraceae bacterium AZCC 1564]